MASEGFLIDKLFKQIAIAILVVLVLAGASTTVYLMYRQQKDSPPNPAQLQQELQAARDDYEGELIPLMDQVQLAYDSYLDSSVGETEALLKAIESLDTGVNQYRVGLSSFFELEQKNRKFLALNQQIISAIEDHETSESQLNDVLKDHDQQMDEVAEILTRIRVEVIQPTLNLARERNNQEQLKFWMTYEQSWREDLNQPFQSYMRQMAHWETKQRSTEALDKVMSTQGSLAKGLENWKLNARLNQDLDRLSAPLQKEIDALGIELVDVGTKVTLVEEDQFLLVSLKQQWVTQREDMAENLANFKVTDEMVKAHASNNSQSNVILILIVFFITLVLLAFLIGAIVAGIISQSKYGGKFMGSGLLGSRPKRREQQGELFSNENYVKKLVEERHREALSERQFQQQYPGEPGGNFLPDEMVTVVDAIEQLSSSIREMSGTITDGQDQKMILPGASLATGSLSEIAGKAEFLAKQASLKVDSMTEVQSEIQLITDTMKEVAHNVSRLSVNVSIEVAASTKENPELNEIVKELKELAGQTVQAVEQMAWQISSLKHKSADSKEAISDLSEAVKVVSISAGSLSKMMVLTQDAQTEEEHRADARAVADELLESLQRIRVKDEVEKTNTN